MSRPSDSKDTLTHDVTQDLTPAKQFKLASATTQNIPAHHTNVSAPPFQYLPVELHLNIFSHLNPCTSLCLGLTNKYFYDIHFGIHGPLSLQHLFEYSIQFPIQSNDRMSSSWSIYDDLFTPLKDFRLHKDLVETHEDAIKTYKDCQIIEWYTRYLPELFGAYLTDLKECKSRLGCRRWRYESKVGWKDADILMAFIPPGMWHESFFKASRAVLNDSSALINLYTTRGTLFAWGCTCHNCCDRCCPTCNEIPDTLRHDVLWEAYLKSIGSVDWMEYNREPISFCDFSQVLNRIWDSLHDREPSCLFCAAYRLAKAFGAPLGWKEHVEWTLKLRDRKDYGQDMSGAWNHEVGIVAQQYFNFQTYYKREEQRYREGVKWGVGFQRIVNKDDIWDMMQDWGDKNLELEN